MEPDGDESKKLDEHLVVRLEKKSPKLKVIILFR